MHVFGVVEFLIGRVDSSEAVALRIWYAGFAVTGMGTLDK